jgi:hypothetical protein
VYGEETTIKLRFVCGAFAVCFHWSFRETCGSLRRSRDREIFEREREREKGLRGIFLDDCQGRRLKFGGSSSSSLSSSSYMWTMVCLSKRREAGRQLDWKEHEALGSYSATCMYVCICDTTLQKNFESSSEGTPTAPACTSRLGLGFWFSHSHSAYLLLGFEDYDGTAGNSMF